MGSEPGTALITGYLRARQLRYSTDDDGDIRVVFASSETDALTLTMLLSLEGKDSDILALRCYSDRTIRDSEFDAAIIACNRWNLEKRWPRAFCSLEQPWQILLDMHVMVGDPSARHAVETTLDTWFWSAQSFWEWIQTSNALASGIQR